MTLLLCHNKIVFMQPIPYMFDYMYLKIDCLIKHTDTFVDTFGKLYWNN